MTGVEAVSNGVTAFAEPRANKAKMTLTVIIIILAVLLYGTAWLAQTVRHYGDGAGCGRVPEPAEPAGDGGVWADAGFTT